MLDFVLDIKVNLRYIQKERILEGVKIVNLQQCTKDDPAVYCALKALCLPSFTDTHVLHVTKLSVK